LDSQQNIGQKIVEEVSYEFVKSPEYTGNGLGRLLNMIHFSWNFLRSASEYVKKYGRPDVVIASSPHPYAFLATHMVAKRYGAKSFFEVRDLWPLSLVELAGVSSKHPLITFTNWVERFAYKKADRVVSLLPLTQEYMAEKGLDLDRWVYIPNGIDSDEVGKYQKKHPCVALAKKWNADGFTVLAYTGALGRPNHVESLVRAINILKRKGNQSIKVIIVGRGEQEVELRRLVQSMELEQDVIIFGQVPKSEVMGLLDEVDVGYISLRPESIFRFGVSPNKLFDYMLAGLPVIFSIDAGNNPVAEAGCGFSVPPGDADLIAQAMLSVDGLSRQQRREMGGKGRDYVLRKHEYSQLAKSYLDLLK
jgi:glycosyltransferase involved in cell wall biosynthesis